MLRSYISPDLLEAYLAADYRIDAGAQSFHFRVQQHSPELAKLLAEAGVSGAVFITAHNPFSEPQSAAANRAADQRLRQRLQALAGQLFPAAGVDPIGDWPAEPGYLALGLALEMAREVGHEFRQNAIVWIGADALPELILLR